MKSSLIKLIVPICLVFFSQYNLASQPKDLLEAIASFNSAFKNADTKKLDSMLTENYVHTNSGSKAFGKKAWLNWIASRESRVKAGKLLYTEYKTQDLSVVLYQNTAIATGRNIARGKDNATNFRVDIRFTQVWIKESGKWKRAAFHDAKTKD
ncbi:MAG: nuclear transport factor 2 family protein [Kangiellaceae bacterium]|nr:nuclear transport factor 2 family protein [Kangiellaceae bacterium]